METPPACGTSPSTRGRRSRHVHVRRLDARGTNRQQPLSRAMRGHLSVACCARADVEGQRVLVHAVRRGGKLAEARGGAGHSGDAPLRDVPRESLPRPDACRSTYPSLKTRRIARDLARVKDGTLSPGHDALCKPRRSRCAAATRRRQRRPVGGRLRERSSKRGRVQARNVARDASGRHLHQRGSCSAISEEGRDRTGERRRVSLDSPRGGPRSEDRTARLTAWGRVGRPRLPAV